MKRKFFRSQDDKIIAGVCGGLANYFDIDATLIRLFFIFLVTFGASGFIIYLLLWLITPVSDQQPAIINEEKIKEFSKEINEKIGELKEGIKKSDSEVPAEIEKKQVRNRSRETIFGWVLIFLGAVFLFNNLAPLWLRARVLIYWPLIFIFLGFILIVKKSKNKELKN